MLDLDTEGAIKGARRIDIFLGSEELASARTRLLNGSGKLHCLLLKE
ncbi:MAG: 3D domain-containing protein [Prochloraceae cyanobacterium]